MPTFTTRLRDSAQTTVDRFRDRFRREEQAEKPRQPQIPQSQLPSMPTWQDRIATPERAPWEQETVYSDTAPVIDNLQQVEQRLYSPYTPQRPTIRAPDITALRTLNEKLLQQLAERDVQRQPEVLDTKTTPVGLRESPQIRQYAEAGPTTIRTVADRTRREETRDDAMRRRALEDAQKMTLADARRPDDVFFGQTRTTRDDLMSPKLERQFFEAGARGRMVVDATRADEIERFERQPIDLYERTGIQIAPPSIFPDFAQMRRTERELGQIEQRTLRDAPIVLSRIEQEQQSRLREIEPVLTEFVEKDESITERREEIEEQIQTYDDIDRQLEQRRTNIESQRRNLDLTDAQQVSEFNQQIDAYEKDLQENIQNRRVLDLEIDRINRDIEQQEQIFEEQIQPFQTEFERKQSEYDKVLQQKLGTISAVDKTRDLLPQRDILNVFESDRIDRIQTARDELPFAETPLQRTLAEATNIRDYIRTGITRPGRAIGTFVGDAPMRVIRQDLEGAQTPTQIGRVALDSLISSPIARGVYDWRADEPILNPEALKGGIYTGLILGGAVKGAMATTPVQTLPAITKAEKTRTWIKPTLTYAAMGGIVGAPPVLEKRQLDRNVRELETQRLELQQQFERGEVPESTYEILDTYFEDSLDRARDRQIGYGRVAGMAGQTAIELATVLGTAATTQTLFTRPTTGWVDDSVRYSVKQDAFIESKTGGVATGAPLPNLKTQTWTGTTLAKTGPVKTTIKVKPVVDSSAKKMMGNEVTMTRVDSQGYKYVTKHQLGEARAKTEIFNPQGKLIKTVRDTPVDLSNYITPQTQILQTDMTDPVVKKVTAPITVKGKPQLVDKQLTQTVIRKDDIIQQGQRAGLRFDAEGRIDQVIQQVTKTTPATKTIREPYMLVGDAKRGPVQAVLSPKQTPIRETIFPKLQVGTKDQIATQQTGLTADYKYVEVMPNVHVAKRTAIYQRPLPETTRIIRTGDVDIQFTGVSPIEQFGQRTTDIGKKILDNIASMTKKGEVVITRPTQTFAPQVGVKTQPVSAIQTQKLDYGRTQVGDTLFVDRIQQPGLWVEKDLTLPFLKAPSEYVFSITPLVAAGPSVLQTPIPEATQITRPDELAFSPIDERTIPLYITRATTEPATTVSPAVQTSVTAQTSFVTTPTTATTTQPVTQTPTTPVAPPATVAPSPLSPTTGVGLGIPFLPFPFPFGRPGARRGITGPAGYREWLVINPIRDLAGEWWQRQPTGRERAQSAVNTMFGADIASGKEFRDTYGKVLEEDESKESTSSRILRKMQTGKSSPFMTGSEDISKKLNKIL